ncbi:MAG TPA: hypothetical protein ENJ82_02250, partial [Bacteroidetes bacterium]|nr:hypothetical protein [Bacteroidota bacterium]
MFRFYCYLFFLPMLMFSCVPAADGEDQKKLPDSEAVGPSGKVASRLETVQESVLGDMRGMNYLEAEAIDDFRNRIKQDNWGNVCALLRETDAIIRQKGKDFLELRA